MFDCFTQGGGMKNSFRDPLSSLSVTKTNGSLGPIA